MNTPTPTHDHEADLQSIQAQYTWAKLGDRNWDRKTGKWLYTAEAHKAFPQVSSGRDALKSRDAYLAWVAEWKTAWKFIASEIKTIRANRRKLKAAGYYKPGADVEVELLPLKSPQSCEDALSKLARALVEWRVTMKRLSYETKQAELERSAVA